MSRWKAFAIHFSISLAVFLVLLTIILMVWYPGILFSIDGGWTGLRIIIGVDLVLGPLLTLIVFKAGKPGLKFDLTCIGVAQALCMAGGMWVVYQERPLALVLAFDTVYSVAAKEFEDFEKDTSVLEDFPGRYPKLVYAELPEDDIAAGIATIRSYFIGDPLYIQTEKYRAIPEDSAAAAVVFRRDQPLRGSITEELQEQLAENCLFSKFISSVTGGYVCFDPEQRELSAFYGNQYTREATPPPAPEN